MEKRIKERLQTAKRRRIAHNRSDALSARERKQLNQLDTTGSWIDHLTDFQTEELEDMLIEDGLASEIVRLIGQGKEANVYWIKDDNGKDKALKIFRMFTTSHRDSFSKEGGYDKLGVAESFALREYLNLSYAEDAGVRVPKRGIREEFIVTMDFLGNEEGPAPLLRNVDLEEIGVDPLDVLDDVLDQLEVMFNDAQLVHGDFSEHNLVWYQDKIWVIDFLQSQRWHPNYATPERIRKHKALDILENDVQSVLNHFKRNYRTGYFLDNVMDTLVHEKIDDWTPMGLMSEYYNPNWVNTKGRRKR